MKKLILKLLGYTGYTITKIMPTPLKKEVGIRIGKFDLIFPNFNPLIKTYREQPDFAGEISRLTSAVMKKYPDLVFLDVGANAGDTAARVKLVADIPILSIEGDDISFSYLQRNTRQFEKMTLVKQFLGETEGVINASLDKKGWNTTIVPSATGDSSIGIKTLDTVLRETAVPTGRKKIFKVDTEGFDTIIIRGASQFLQEEKPVIYLEFNRDNMNAINEDGLSTILRLTTHGYDKILFFDDRGRYILTTRLNDKPLIESLVNYANGKDGLIYYYNLCIFHEEDSDLALNMAAAEIAIG